MRDPFLIIATMFFFSCNLAQQKDKAPIKQPVTSKLGTLQADSVLKESFQIEDTANNKLLDARIKPIQANFKRINSIVNWSVIDKKNLEESSEGGEATFYYVTGVLNKIVTRHFGETFQILTEYYLLNGQLSFVFAKTYKYNRSIYYDSALMKKENDNQAFDFEKSEIVEDRSYFETNKLIRKVTNQNDGSAFDQNHLLEEQKRLITDFANLKIMAKQQ